MKKIYVKRSTMKRFTDFLGFSVYPFVVIREDFKNARWLIAHEEHHARRQKEVGTVKWLFKYFTSRKFKLKEELGAHAAAVKAGQKIGNAAQQLANNYGLKITYGYALSLLIDEVRNND